MASLVQIRNKANTKLQAFWDVLSTRQEAYRLKRDDYFQLLATSKAVDGEDTPFSVLHPSDQQYAGDVNLTFNSPIPFQIRVDTWGNDTEKGYKATVVIELLDGRQFTRSRSLTDTRVRKRDVIDNSDVGNIILSDPYFEGPIPTIETTDWEEIIEQLWQ